MDITQKVIVKQCAMKVATKLVIAKSEKVSISELTNEIKQVTEELYQELIKDFDVPGVSYKYGPGSESENNSDQKEYSSKSNVSTENQINYISGLIKKVPAAIGEDAQKQLDSGLTFDQASALIKSLIAEEEKAKPVAKKPSNEDYAPF